MIFSWREHLLSRGFCTGPVDAAPRLGEVDQNHRATCRVCGKRVTVTKRGLYANHKPPETKTTTNTKGVPK